MNEDDLDSEPGEAENSTPSRLTSTPRSTYGSKKGRGTSTTPTCRSRKVVEKRTTSSSDGAGALLNDSHFLPPPTPSPDGANVLKEITSLLNTVVKRMDRMENELKQQRSTVSYSSASDTGKTIKKKTSVPLVVRVS